MHIDLQFAVLDQVEHGGRVALELVARDDVAHDGGAHDGDVLGGKALDLDGWDGAGCVAEVDDWVLVARLAMLGGIWTDFA